MGRGQSSLEYLLMIAVALLVLGTAVKYLSSSAKGTPIVGITYIDPELSPEKPGYDHPVTWIVYKYPPGCKATKNCDFYVSVNLHYYPDRDLYKVWVYANGDSDRIREINVRLCTGDGAKWVFPDDKGKNKIRGKSIEPEEFPCQIYITAYMR